MLDDVELLGGRLDDFLAALETHEELTPEALNGLIQEMREFHADMRRVRSLSISLP